MPQDAEVMPHVHPVGRRKAKEMATKEDVARKKLKAAEEALAAQRQWNEIMEAHR